MSKGFLVPIYARSVSAGELLEGGRRGAVFMLLGMKTFCVKYEARLLGAECFGSLLDTCHVDAHHMA